MGASQSTTVIETTNDKGETVWNGSKYTYMSDVPQMVENYPWVVWEANNVLGEDYMIRLILEISLWGLLSFLLTGGCNIAGIALSADTDFPHGIGNDKG